MKNYDLVLIGIVSIGILVLGIRWWAEKSGKNSFTNLTSLQQLADSGVSLEQLLSKAAKFDYVINKVSAISPKNIKLEPDNSLAWDQTSSLNESNISEIAKIQTGEIELRRKAGGYFLNLKIVNGIIETSRVSYPPAE